MPECYMCNVEGNTREHVPPQSFFPEGHRNNLIVVPSCSAHNHDNSTDVEYTRTIVVTSLGTNSKARQFFPEQPLRALQRNDKSLQNRTFANRFPIRIQNEEYPEGEETTFFKIEKDRVNSIFQAMAYGLYFHDTGNRFDGIWMVFLRNIYMKETLDTGVATDHDRALFQVCQAFEIFPFSQMKTSNPEIFTYYSFQDDTHTLYKLVFFEGFTVYIAPPKFS